MYTHVAMPHWLAVKLVDRMSVASPTLLSNSPPFFLTGATALATNSWLDVHTFTESGGGRVEGLMEGGRGVNLDRRATLGTADQGKVDAGVHWHHHLQAPTCPCVGLSSQC